MKLNYPIIATLMLGGFALVNIAVIWHATSERTGTAEGAVSGPKPALAERPKQSATAAAANTPADESKQKKTGSQGQPHQPARNNKNEKAAGALPGTKVQPGTSQSRPGIQDRYARAEVLDTRMVTDLQNPLVRTRIRLVKTDFKYPLLRVVDKLHASRNGEEEKLVQQSTMVADHVMVKLNKGFTDDDLQRAIKPFGGRVRKKFPITKNYLIEIPEATMDSVEKTLLQLQVPAVSVAEPDYIVRATLMPDDEKFSQLWGMHNTGQTGGTGDADIDAPEAWNLSTGSRNVLVGVIDTGVDYTHPDLAPNMWTNTHEIPGNGVDDDANGYVDDTRGWDFYNVDNDPMDDHFHGTHCAGTIGAVGGNGVGVAGVCWHVSLVGLKFLNKDGGGTTSDAAEATAYATRIGVDLTSNSWGGSDYNTALADAISAANDEGVLFVAAAGNDGVSNDEESNYPSNYDYPNVIAVAASDHADNLTNFSNYGVTQVDLAAPGKNILSCTIGGGYLSVSGTSMATPHVAGACALLKAYRPELPHLAVRDIVIHSGDARPELADTIASGRRLNLSNALDFHELTFSPTTPFVASGPNGGPFSPTSRTFTITNHAQTPQTWTVAKNATWLDLSEAGGTLGPGTSTNIIVSVNSWASDLPQGIYEDALTVTNVTTGRSSQCSFTLYAGSPDFYTEEFDAASNALDPHEYDFQRFVFTPDSTQKTYSVYRSSVTGFNTDPTGGTAIDLVPTGLGAEPFVKVTLANGKQVPYFEAGYSDIYISCNGHIRFLPPPPPFYSYGISLDKHLAKPGVAALLENFAPETSDQVSMRELIDRVVVTWQNVASWGDTDSNSFQIELYFDGRIAITHLNVARNSGIIGLSRGQGRPINFALSDFRNYPAASQFKVELPPAAVEGRGLMEGRGIVSVTPATETALMVTLVSSGASELVLPSSIMIPAGKTRAFFDVNIMDDAFVDGSQTATATASAPGFIDGSGSIIVHDNESAFLSVLLPASTAESSAPVTGSVLVTPAPIHDVVVQLYSDDLSEATVPATVTINAGQTSASFNLSPVNDTLIDGPQAIHITAQVSGWTTGSSSIIVNDDEARQLALVLPTSAAEGKTGLNGQVSLSGSISTTLVVSLQCSDTSEIMVPTTVKISAGRSSASFPITVADDGLIDGSQPVVITATADTFTGGSGNLVVEDNDPHHFSFSVISGTQVKNGSFLATITALNADNSVMTNFTGPVSLSGIGVAGPVGVSPAVINGFVGGVWTGTLAVTAADTNVILTVADNHGKVGASNEFDVLAMGPHNAFAWNAIPQAQVNGSGIPVSLTAIDAGRNPVTTFGGTATISGMQESTQTIGTSTSTTHDLPFNTNYEEERSQIIYTTAELGGAKYLTSLAFFVTDVGVPSLLTHLCVRLRHTSKADFSGSGAVWERDIDLITVFEGDQKLVQGWNTFLFNAPFRYNGTSNLLVDVCYDLAANSSLAWTTVRRTAATTNRAMYATAFLNQKGDPAAWVGSTPLPTLSTRVPNIRFGILTPVAVSPSVSGTFSAGQWQGVVTVSQELKNFRLLASDASGHEGLSQAFDVLPYVPVIGISPASLSFSVPYGGTQTKSLTIFNTGQGVLNWSLGNVADNSLNAHNQSMKLDLTQVRQELNTAYHSITSLIPNRFDFDGGEVGNSIGENNNLYFDGNWLNTNLGSRRSYSNDAIISTTAFGVGGSYFTRKYPGLFVLAADALNISHFEVSGSLAGYATNMDTSVITQSRGSMTYKGFIKRVFGPTVPSVNHLIIVADNGSVNHTAAADPADDLHRVSSLNGISRLYYLLFSRWQNQAGYVSDAVMADIMSTFLDTVESPKEFVFSTAAGTVVPGGSKTVSVTANTMNVPSGIYSRSLVLTTGHAAVPLVTIPVTLQIFAAGDSDGDSLPDTWETRYGWTPGNTNLNQAASGDPDGDGVTNLMEYLLDLNPELADNQQMPAASTTVNPADDDPYLTYCYRRRVGVSGLVYTVQVSSILGSWVSGPAETEEISVTPNAGGESETVVVRIKPAMNAPGHNKKFVRLQVTTP